MPPGRAASIASEARATQRVGPLRQLKAASDPLRTKYMRTTRRFSPSISGPALGFYRWLQRRRIDGRVPLRSSGFTFAHEVHGRFG